MAPNKSLKEIIVVIICSVNIVTFTELLLMAVEWLLRIQGTYMCALIFHYMVVQSQKLL